MIKIIKKYINRFFNNNKFFKRLERYKEFKILFFFVFLLSILIGRLFYVQIVNADYYEEQLISQHSNQSTLEAERGNIYLTDKSGDKTNLTKNVDLYNLYVDPRFINNDDKVIELILPIVYKHLCEQNGMEEVNSKEECVRNIEDFSGEDIIPDKQEENFYITGGSNKQNLINVDVFRGELKKSLKDFTGKDAKNLIKDKLYKLVKGGLKDKNYLGFFENKSILKKMKELKLDSVEISGNYVYILPEKVNNKNIESKKLFRLLHENGYNYKYNSVENKFEERKIRYKRIAVEMNSKLAQKIKKLKNKYRNEKGNGIPLLHGLGLEETNERYYPYDKFLSHVLGYVNDKGEGVYGIEEYFDDLLSGKDGRMIGLSVPWIGEIGSNNIDIKQPEDGSDIYLTIDPQIQRTLENILKKYYKDLNPDSISSIIMDPKNGEVVASANYPNYNPNNYMKYYQVEPLSYEDRHLVNKNEYMDIPLLVKDNGTLRRATFSERKNPQIQKYKFQKKLGPQTFIDKNISSPIEPGSIFKTFTLAIGIDIDQIDLYDFYYDEQEVRVGPYTISNVFEEKCRGRHTYLNALRWSCNVGMVNIVQQVGKYAYYSYLEKLGFGKLTGIQLAKEDEGNLVAENNFSKARFFNNSFGQGILTTPIQIATAYSSLVNGGYLYKPTIVEKIYNNEDDTYTNINKQVINKVFSKETVKQIKEALAGVLKVDKGRYSEDHIGSKVGSKEYTIGGKSGTTELTFKGKYKSEKGWTIGSFVSIITVKNPKYVIVTQVRRPRERKFGGPTAGYINGELHKFLLEYSSIEN